VIAHDLHTITFFDDQENRVREITEGRLVVQTTNTFADSIRVATGPGLLVLPGRAGHHVHLPQLNRSPPLPLAERLPTLAATS
jgi:hypothetical protein